MATETMLLILLCLCLAPLPGSSKDSTFTFRLPPGRTECFYEYINQGALLEVEYQVREAIKFEVGVIQVITCLVSISCR